MSDERDQALLLRFRSGDREAFALLVRHYQRPLYNAAYRILGNADDADDVAQTAFLRIVERLHDYDPKFKFFSWIYRIAINEAIDFSRRTAREEEIDEDVEFAAPDHAGPEWQAHAREVSSRVQRALLEMKMDDRVVITLRHFADCSYQDIASILSLDEKTVKSRLFEARRRLSAVLGDLKETLS